jgi:hypothetical protein
MALQSYNVDGITYSIAVDDPQSPGRLTWALVVTRLIDELTGEPPSGAVSISTPQSGLFPRVGRDGLAGFAGTPADAFPLLATQNYQVDVTVEVRRYVTVEQRILVPFIPGFPGSFAPVPAGDIRLHRSPTVIHGRVVFVTASARVPVAGAAVTVTGIWRTAPPANVALPPDPPNLVSLQPALYFPRAAATGSLRRRDLLPVAGQDKTLLDDSPAGASSVHISDRVGLIPGSMVAIDPADPGRSEFFTIASMAGAATPDQPARITLSYPTVHAHRPGAGIEVVTPQPPGVSNALAQDAIRGDSCVFLSTMNGLVPGGVIEIFGGPNPTEFHRAGLFATVTNALGYYRLPLLSRVAQLDIQANDGVHLPLKVTFSPDYTRDEVRLDFELT